MNLTSFLKHQKASTFVEAFSHYLETNSKSIILTGETHKHTVRYGELTDYALVGTAYDYLLRSRIACLNNLAIDAKQLVAYVSLNYLIQTRHKDVELIQCISEIIKTYLYDIIPLFREAYTHKQKLTKEYLHKMIIVCLQLAKIDAIYRNQQIPTINELSEQALMPYVGDLTQLWINTDMSLFDSELKCFSLNPVIGQFTLNNQPTEITKADGDLIIDDRIIDIKTTSKIDYTHFIQVFCYAVMINHKFNTKIDTLQLYFSRYNRMATISMKCTELHALQNHFIQSVQK